MFRIFIYITIIDLVSGFLKAIYLREFKSDTGLKGLLKHGTIIMIGGLHFLLPPHVDELRTIFNTFISLATVYNALSIFENLAQMGYEPAQKIISMFRKED